MENVRTFVIHVRGNRQRELHISSEMSRHNIKYEFILDGNMEDITEKLLEKYFTGEMKKVSPRASCALKHFFVYEKMIEENIPVALVFEDDIELYDSFQNVFESSVSEARKENLENFIISYESSTQNFISNSEAVSGKYLYRKSHGRCAGAYLLNLNAAKTILQYAYHEKCGTVLDWFHNEFSDKGLLGIYWCHPPVAEQQSHNGKVFSLLDEKKQGYFYRVKFFLQKKYKEKILSRFR